MNENNFNDVDVQDLTFVEAVCACGWPDGMGVVVLLSVGTDE